MQKAEIELVQVETEIRRQPKMLTLSKSITTDPFLHQAATEATKRDFVELSRLKLTNEELNPVYINLDQVRVNLSVQVAALTAERVGIAQAIAQLANEVGGCAGILLNSVWCKHSASGLLITPSKYTM